MNTEPNNSIIENCFDDYEKIQIQHLKIIRSNSNPNLDVMTRERETVFQTLKVNLEAMMENAGLIHGTDCISELSKHEDRLNSIMNLDQEISIEIKKYRDSLKNSLNHMKKGKAAMNGYRVAGTNSPTPRVLSMNR
ncbi:MAG: hypothetical protein K8R53_01430 [Bacteroidales bacterium]|nr:hypothetical protein [Bacteroidales bacterium]